MSCHLPTDCVLAITYRCNSRCTMCDIWKITEHRDMDSSEYLNLPRSLRDVNISGGEPFLRADIAEITTNVARACPKARIVVSTNGFATDLIVRRMKEILKIKPGIGVAVSIDGIGDMHNEMRGIAGGFDKSIDTVKALRKLGMKNLRLAFTVTEKNVLHFSKVYDLSRELGVQFTHSFAQSSEFYFGGKMNINNPRQELLDEQYRYVIKKELRTWEPKRWARAYFAHGMRNFISSKTPSLSSAPGRDFFFMDPSGVIYPSVAHNMVMGKIDQVKSERLPPSQRGPASGGDGVPPRAGKMKSFEQLWCSMEMGEVRKKIDAMKVPVWMICTARTAIKRHPIKVASWIMKNKICSKPWF